jgi:hypothetical protein
MPKKTPETIRISADVFRALQRAALPGETPNRTIRRLLGIDPTDPWLPGGCAWCDKPLAECQRPPGVRRPT